MAGLSRTHFNTAITRSVTMLMLSHSLLEGSGQVKHSELPSMPELVVGLATGCLSRSEARIVDIKVAVWASCVYWAERVVAGK